MATIENRSRFIVQVHGQADLERQFPFGKLAQATAYRDELLAAGLRPTLDQLDDHWLASIRQRGYPPQRCTFGSRTEAAAFVLKVEEERSKGPLTDDTKAHETSLAELLVCYLENEVPDTVRGSLVRYKIESWLTDSGAHGVRLLQAHRDRLRANGESIRSVTVKIRKPSTELAWIHKRLTEVTTADLQDFIDKRLEAVTPSAVDREIDLLKTVFKVAITVWGYPLAKNPMDAVRRPIRFNKRNRRLERDEERRLLDALSALDRARAVEEHLAELADNELSSTHYSSSRARKKALAEVRMRLLPLAEQSCRTVPYLETFYHFQILTGARPRETLSLTWDCIDLEAGTVILPLAMNGPDRKLLLRADLLQLLSELPRDTERVFAIGQDALAGAWNHACQAAGINDLNIYDLRYEAIRRMVESGQLSLPEVRQSRSLLDTPVHMSCAHR